MFSCPRAKEDAKQDVSGSLLINPLHHPFDVAFHVFHGVARHLVHNLMSVSMIWDVGISNDTAKHQTTRIYVGLI